MVRRVLALAMTAATVASVAGCGSKLEDGYEPRKLGVSSDVRRSYYADPFSPEATVTDKSGNGAPPARDTQEP